MEWKPNLVYSEYKHILNKLYYYKYSSVTTGLGPANGNRKRRDSNNVIEQI